MTSQNSREFFYFRVPVFLVDLAIHLATLYFLFSAAPVERLAGLENGPAVYALLFVSFCIGVEFTPLKLHERRIKLRNVLWRAVKQTAVTYLAFTVLLSLVFKAAPRYLLFQELGITFVLITLWHWMANKTVRTIRHAGHNIRKVVIVGADVTAQRVYRELSYGRSFSGYDIWGFFSSLPDVTLPEGAKMLGTVEECWEWLEKHRPDEIYCSLPPASCPDEVNRLIKLCNDNFIDFFFVPTFDGYPKRHVQVNRLGNVNVIRLREEPLNSPTAKIVKRGFDILASGLFLCTLYPFVVLFVWIGNKLTGNVGPLYFKQARTGYNGKSFNIYKFRSMKVNKDADKLQATENDPRKTPFGDFLRRSSIDELPQFINVFKGDMSVIGPRPHMEFHTEMYSALIGNYMVRHLAKPGITGWAQISGCRGETKTVEEMQDRVEHDIWYIEHWSPLLDTEIFFRTIWQVLPGHDKQAY